jgi:hypothetical protein
LSLEETPIDDQYTMVKAHFLMEFQTVSVQVIEAKVDSMYLLLMKGKSPKIVMHIEHEDLKEAMRERGLFHESQQIS